VKYANDLFLLVKEEKVIQVVSDRVTETGRCYGMEMNVGKKNYVNENLKTTIPSTGSDRSKTKVKCGIFEIFV
jgi:hypothetical protein